MAKIINIKSFIDERGALSVIENEIGFNVKRVFYIYNVDHSTRGKHRHKKTIQAAICINGSCKIFNDNNIEQEVFELNSKNKCLLLYPEDYHYMYDFSKDAILLVLASELYDYDDYIFEPYI